MSLGNPRKSLDPSSVAVPLGIDWTDWLQKLGPSVTLASATWTFTTPLTGAPTIVGNVAYANVTAHDAAPGSYEAACHVRASNNVEDARRLYVTVKRL